MFGGSSPLLQGLGVCTDEILLHRSARSPTCYHYHLGVMMLYQSTTLLYLPLHSTILHIHAYHKTIISLPTHYVFLPAPVQVVVCYWLYVVERPKAAKKRATRNNVSCFKLAMNKSW